MKAEFNNTVSILVKGYLSGTLYKGSCAACAVGNICAAALGVQVDPSDLSDNGWVDSEEGPMWHHLFMTNAGGWQNRFYQQEDFEPELICNQMGIEQAQKTGYTVSDLARIEKAFEGAELGYNDEASYAGLMAVVDVLADIHGIDLATAEVAKRLFAKEPA